MNDTRNVVEISLDSSNFAIVNLHGQYFQCTSNKDNCISNAGATLQSWVHEDKEMIFVRYVCVDPVHRQWHGLIFGEGLKICTQSCHDFGHSPLTNMFARRRYPHMNSHSHSIHANTLCPLWLPILSFWSRHLQ